MKFKEIYSDDNELHAIVEDSGESFMNLVRRTSSFGIKTFAIEDVTFIQNNSALYDEILAQRLGLLPLRVNKDIFTLKKPEVHFTLNVEVLPSAFPPALVTVKTPGSALNTSPSLLASTSP